MLRMKHAAVWGVAWVLLGCGSDVALEGGGSGVGGAQAGGGSVQATASSTGGSGSSTGTGGAGTIGGASAQGGSTSTGTVEICGSFGQCQGCVANACPDVWCSCVGNPECSALFECVVPCNGEDACVQGCMSQYPNGISDVVLVNDCASTTCTDSCPNAGADPLTPCQTCLYDSCPDAMNGCLSQSECLTLLGCIQACGPNDLSCHNDCYNAHPDGIDPLELVLDCSTMSCPDTCN